MLVILHRAQDATFSNSRRGWIVLLLNNNLRNMKNKFNQSFKFKTCSIPYKIATKKHTRKVNFLSSKCPKVTAIGPMIFLLFNLYRRKKSRKQKNHFNFLVILSFKKKKKVACIIQEAEISENKRFKFNEIGLGRFLSLSLSEGALGVLQYYKNENFA